MSNVGQGALVIAGAVVGAVLAPATGGLSAELTWGLIGGALGAAGGQVLFPTQLPNATGPRIGDNATTTATLGDPIPIGYGTFPSAGTVIFLGPLVEHSTTTQSGKG